MFGILDHLFGKTESEEQRIFALGRKQGYEEGVINGMAKNFERSAELPEEEYTEVMRYLVSHQLELCCYDINRGGFRVRKRKFSR